MSDQDKIKRALEQTKIFKSPEELLSSSEKTSMHYYVLTEPAYLEVYPEEGPETRIREGWITWDRPKLITPGYLMKAEGFSDEARQALEMIASSKPDLASLIYKMSFQQKVDSVRTAAKTIEETAVQLDEESSEEDRFLTVILSGLEELWDVSLMKFVEEYMAESASESHVPDMEERGYLTRNQSGQVQVTRTLEGLPIAARDEIERLFDKVKGGEAEPSILKKELDRWGVYQLYEDRFLDLFRSSK